MKLDELLKDRNKTIRADDGSVYYQENKDGKISIYKAFTPPEETELSIQEKLLRICI